MAVKVQVFLNDADISSSVDWTSIQGNLVLTKNVSTFQFNIKITPQISLPKPNDQIDLWINGNLHYFGGLVTTVEITNMGGKQLMAAITATDWGFQLNTRLIAKNYAGEDPADIVADIINNYAPAGYSLSGVQRGNFLLPSIKFNYVPLFKALQQLATLIGWDCNITADKVVQFFLDMTYPAPFGIDDTSGNQEWMTLDLTQDLTNMKNSVTVIGSTYDKVFSSTPVVGPYYPPIDVYTSVAGTFVYPLAYPYDIDTMIVTLAGTPQTVGQAQVSDPGSYQVLYSDTGRYIQFTSDPGGGNAIIVQGTAKVPIVAHASDPIGIAEYGQIQDSIVDKTISTVQEAFLRAQADVLQYGHAVNDLKFNTITPGLFPGMQINFNSTVFSALPNLVMPTTLTIKTITLAPYGPNNIEFQVECYGSDVPTFVDIMSVLLQQENQQNPVDDSTVTEVLIPVTETVNVADTVIVTSTAAPYQWGGTPQVRGDFSKGS